MFFEAEELERSLRFKFDAFIPCYLEHTSGSTVGDSTASSTTSELVDGVAPYRSRKNVVLEGKRRKRLNDKLYGLRSVVPNIYKLLQPDAGASGPRMGGRLPPRRRWLRLLRQLAPRRLPAAEVLSIVEVDWPEATHTECHQNVMKPDAEPTPCRAIAADVHNLGYELSGRPMPRYSAGTNGLWTAA